MYSITLTIVNKILTSYTTSWTTNINKLIANDSQWVGNISKLVLNMAYLEDIFLTYLFRFYQE